MGIRKATFLDTKEIAEGFDFEFTFDNVPIRKLLIANIPKEATHKEIKRKFSYYGKIENCILKRRQKHGKSYAFVTYSSIEDSVEARSAGELRYIHIRGQYLRVLPANSWHQPESIGNRKGIDESPKELCDNDELEKEFNSKCTIDDEEAAIHKLNDDCLLHIFMYLSVYQRIKIERVCKRWMAVSREVWRSFKNLDFSDSKFKPNLRYTDFWKMTFKAPFLYQILHRSGDFITNIDFSGIHTFKNLGNNTIIMIEKLCPNVQSINYGEIQVKVAQVKALAQNCTNIKILRIQKLDINSELIMGNVLSSLFARNRSLQCIELTQDNSPMLPIKCLYSLPHKSVNEISLRILPTTSIPHLSKIIVKFQSLRVLKLKFPINSEIDCTALMTSIRTLATSLTVLEMSGLQFGYGNVIPVAELRNLEELNVSKSGFVDDELLKTLSATCKLLTNLNISDCRYVTNLGLSRVASLPNLLHLDVSYLTVITDEVFDNMTTLKTLNCSYCSEVGNAGLINLIALANDLETLKLTGCDLISDELFKAATESTKFRINDKTLTIVTNKTGIEFDRFLATGLLKITRI